MSGNPFLTPSNVSRYEPSSSSSPRSTVKRTSLQAELERDPQLSTAKRQQRSQVFTSNMAHASLERQLAASQTSKMELETKLREKDLLIERLERDRRWFADREKEEREEKEKERSEHDEDKRKVESDLRTLRNSFTALTEEHADLQDAHSTLSRTTAQLIASQKSQITTLSRQVSVLEEELAQVQQIAEERSRNIKEMQEQLDELSSAQYTKGAEDENMVVVREELHRQANYLRTLEGTNLKLTAELNVLRERSTSVEILREEKRSLERKVKVLDDLREKVVSLEAEVEAGRQEREEWASRNAEATTPSKTPISVTQSLSALRLTHARLLEEHGVNVALLRRRESNLADAERREADAQATIEGLEGDLRTFKAKLERRERRTLLAEREVGFLQALVASFTAEEASQDEINIDEAKTQCLQNLETLLADVKRENQKLNEELDALVAESSSLGHGRSRRTLSDEVDRERTANIELQEALRAAEAELQQHVEKIEELEQSLFELGGEIGGGRHVPPGVRVLSLRDNPEQQWVDLRQAAMDSLKGENEALMNRLKKLEASGARDNSNEGGAELVPRESWELVNKEKKDLEEVVKQKEKRLLRLQQVFASKSAEFREAIASILGVKLAFYPNGQVRVTSIYDLSASFVFQPESKTAGATMQLVARGSLDFSGQVYWIETEGCIPGFLAAVTLECYEHWKKERS